MSSGISRTEIEQHIAAQNAKLMKQSNGGLL